jgi:hypothetical protein
VTGVLEARQIAERTDVDEIDLWRSNEPLAHIREIGPENDPRVSPESPPPAAGSPSSVRSPLGGAMRSTRSPTPQPNRVPPGMFPYKTVPHDSSFAKFSIGHLLSPLSRLLEASTRPGEIQVDYEGILLLLLC